MLSYDNFCKLRFFFYESVGLLWNFFSERPILCTLKRDIGCLPFVRINQLERPLNNGKGFSKSGNQPNEMALTICNSISRN